MTDQNDPRRTAEPPADDPSGKQSVPTPVRQSLGATLRRAAALRCPRCGTGKLFRNWFQMPPRCPVCGLRFERGPGYFLGSAYLNYGLTALILTVSYFALHFVAGWSNTALAPFLVTFCVAFPLFYFRYARASWLALDYWLDPVGFAEDPDDGAPS